MLRCDWPAAIFPLKNGKTGQGGVDLIRYGEGIFVCLFPCLPPGLLLGSYIQPSCAIITKYKNCWFIFINPNNFCQCYRSMETGTAAKQLSSLDLLSMSKRASSCGISEVFSPPIVSQPRAHPLCSCTLRTSPQNYVP